jgi:hypothetical protein
VYSSPAVYRWRESIVSKISGCNQWLAVPRLFYPNNIDKLNVTGVLVGNDSQAEILFLSAFDQMGFDKKKQLKAALKPLYGFGGRIIEPIGPISLPISFGTLCNAHTEYITFNVVDMHYPYSIIFCRGLLNTFETTLHSTYLRLKVPAASGVISIHGN